MNLSHDGLKDLTALAELDSEPGGERPTVSTRGRLSSVKAQRALYRVPRR